MVELLISALVFGLPLLMGFVLARKKPDWGPFCVSFLSSLPLGVMFLIGGVLLPFTVSTPPCAGPPCPDPAPLYFWAMMIWGIIALLVGFGLGMVGHALGSKKRKKQASE